MAKRKTTKSTPRKVTSIVYLRKVFPGRDMGHRERDVLYSAGARCREMKSLAKGYYRVTHGNGERFFDFLYNSPHGRNFKVVG